MPIIRPATTADASAVAALTNIIIRDTTTSFKSEATTPEKQTAAITERGPAFLVAQDGDTFLGYATYFPFRGPDGYQHTVENTIVLTESARGHGIGKLLMTQLFTNARSAGIHSMFAGVSAENPAGITFHAKLGFTELARLAQVGRKFDRWLDLVLMQKML